MQSKLDYNLYYFLCETIFDRFLDIISTRSTINTSSLYRIINIVSYVLLQFVVHNYVGDKSGGDLLNLDFKLNEKQLNNKQIRIGIITFDI